MQWFGKVFPLMPILYTVFIIDGHFLNVRIIYDESISYQSGESPRTGYGVFGSYVELGIYRSRSGPGPGAQRQPRRWRHPVWRLTQDCPSPSWAVLVAGRRARWSAVGRRWHGSTPGRPAGGRTMGENHGRKIGTPARGAEAGGWRLGTGAEGGAKWNN